MAEPFTDWASGKDVQGFFFACKEEQAALLNDDLVAPHIRHLAEQL